MVPLQEYILQGSILDSSCEMLLHRLTGLCDNGDSPTEKFEDKEYIYTISKSFGVFSGHPEPSTQSFIER